MKKYHFLLIFIIPIVAIGQTAYYPGIIKLKTDFPYTCSYLLGSKASTYKCNSDTFTLNFFSSPTEKLPTKKLSVFYSFTDNSAVKTVLQNDLNSWLNSRLVKIDTTRGYIFIYLTCKEKKGNWYSVHTCDTTDEVLWINDERFIEFLSWKQLRKKKYEVSVYPRTIAYEKPDTTSKPTNICYKHDCTIGAIKDDWMEVKLDFGEPCDGPVVRKVNGWVHFRDERNLKIVYDIKFW